MRLGSIAARITCIIIALSAVVTTAQAAPRKPVHRPSIVPAGWPQSLTIPRLRVQAPVEHLAFNRAADYAAPYKWGDVAWFDRGPRPGDIGHAAILGHLDSTCCPAIFYTLKYLKAGDIVTVTYRKGKPLHFRVMWQATYPNKSLPVKFLFSEAGGQRALILMTCIGTFYRNAGGYDHKLVVFARIILPNGKLG